MKIMCSDDISSLLMRIFHFHLLSGGGGIASLRPDPQVSGFVDEQRVMLTAGVSDKSAHHHHGADGDSRCQD